MADTSPDNLRGFIVPFDLSADNQWTSQSVLTEGTIRAGVPVANQSSGLVLSSSGLMGSDIIDIKTSEAGHIQNKPKFEWKESTQSEYYGCDAANMMSHFQAVINNDSTANEYYPRHALKLQSGDVLILVENIFNNANNLLAVKYKTDQTVSQVTIVSETVTSGLPGGQYRFGGLCQLPDRSILAATWAANSTDNTAQIHIYRSTDDGVTWTLRSKRALPSNIDISGAPGAGAAGFDLDRIRLASNSSQVCLLVSIHSHNTDLNSRNIMAQYGSTSEGMKFDFVFQSTGVRAYVKPDIVSIDEAFVVSWIFDTDFVHIMRISNAFENLDIVRNYTGAFTLNFNTTGLLTITAKLASGQKTMWMDDDQRLYIAARTMIGSGIGEIKIGHSDLVGVGYDDLGRNWSQYGRSMTGTAPSTCYQPRDTDDNLTTIIGCSGVVGDQMLFSNMTTGDTGNTFKLSLFALHLGGFSTVNYGKLVFYPEDINRGYHYLDWLPIRAPSATGWTAAGTGTETLKGDHVQIDVTSGNTKTFTQTISDKTGGVIAKFRAKVVSGGDNTNGSGLELKIERIAVSQVFHVRLIINTTSVHLYDILSGSTIGQITGLTDTSDGIDIILQLDNSAGDILLCARGATAKARRYSKLTGQASLSAGTGSLIKWGVVTSHSSNIEADWYNVSYAIGQATGKLIDQTDLIGKPYPPQGFFTTIVSGLKISTKDGPARESETYTITPRADTPATRTLYKIHPSRSVGWRSDAISTPDSGNVPEEKIAWQLDTALTQDHRIPGGTLGIHLADINFKDLSVQRYDTGSTAWVSVASFTNGIPFNYVRNGHSITCSDSNGEFFHYAECAGWRVILTSGDDTTLVRKIKFNNEGVLSAGTLQQCVLQLEDAKSGDPTSGSGFLVPSDFTMIFNNNPNTAGYRIVIPAQRTNEGYYQIGKMVMGPVLFPAHQYGRGRTIQFEADTSTEILSNGIQRSNKLGSGGRNIRIAWTEGVDISALFEAQANPNYYKASTSGSAIPTASEGSAPTSMIGMIKHLSGSLEAIVYLPIVRKMVSTELSLNRYHEHVMCTVSDDVQIENVLGDEQLATGAGEVFRVGTVTLREIR
jgi:hypothetical protein